MFLQGTGESVANDPPIRWESSNYALFCYIVKPSLQILRRAHNAMAFVPVPGIVEVFIEHTFHGKPGVGWVVHYESTIDPSDPAVMADMGDSIIAWWIAEMKPYVTAQVTLNRVRMRLLTTANSAIMDRIPGSVQTGTLTGQAMPGNVAFSIKKNTGLAGRSLRGRIYQFGFNEADVDGNNLGVGRASTYVDAWTEALFLAGVEGNYGMVVVSKYSQNQPRVTGIATDVTSISYSDLRLDTRRDRL